jgi:mono/diheme cytochrome c family protein
MSQPAILAGLLALALAAPAVAGPWTRLPSPPPPPATTPAERGHLLFQSRCAICHGTDPDAAGTQSLKVRYAGSKPALLEERTDLKPETVAYFVRHGSGMMPFFRKSELTDAELADVAAWLTRKRPARSR